MKKFLVFEGLILLVFLPLSAFSASDCESHFAEESSPIEEFQIKKSSQPKDNAKPIAKSRLKDNFKLTKESRLVRESTANPRLVEESQLAEESNTRLRTNLTLLLNPNLHIIKNQEGAVSLKKEWKNKVKKYLPDLNRFQLLDLIEKLYTLKKHMEKNNLDLSYERAFLKLLEQRSTQLLPHFDKNQLVEIIYFFVKIELQSPNESFVKAWRKRAQKIKREFKSFERYRLHDWFRRLEIPPNIPAEIN